MEKRVYISADYSEQNGDREVVEILNKLGKDKIHKTNFVDTAKVVSGSVSNDADCRPCDLKEEFNKQINASSYVIFVIGDKTSSRSAGSSCSRAKNDYISCQCTPYKQNHNGATACKVYSTIASNKDGDVGNINSYSYIRHEFEQAKKRNKNIVVVYNSLKKESDWLPSYMSDYESVAQPFWIKNSYGERVENYQFIKTALGYE